MALINISPFPHCLGLFFPQGVLVLDTDYFSFRIYWSWSFMEIYFWMPMSSFAKAQRCLLSNCLHPYLGLAQVCLPHPTPSDFARSKVVFTGFAFPGANLHFQTHEYDNDLLRLQYYVSIVCPWCISTSWYVNTSDPAFQKINLAFTLSVPVIEF